MDLLSLTLIFVWAVYAFETYLELRQAKKLKEKSIPKELTSIVTEEKFFKTQAYELEKSNFGLLESAFSQIETTIIFLNALIPWLWKYSIYSLSIIMNYLYGSEITDDVNGNFARDYEIWVSILFVALSTLYSTILHTPFSLYSTFVIEERHGFNKQTLKL